MKNKMSSLSFFQKIVLILVGIVLSYPPALTYAQRSKLNKTELEFGNGSGWLSIGTEDAPAMQAKKPILLNTGKTVEEVFEDYQSIEFYGQFQTPQEMQDALKTRMRGMISTFAYIPSAESGWIICDGSEYSSAQHTELATLLKDTYGGTGFTNPEGDWIGTFKVPDMRGLFIMGSLDPALLKSVTLNTTVPYHNHTIVAGGTINSGQPSGTHIHSVTSLMQRLAAIDDDDRRHLTYGSSNSDTFIPDTGDTATTHTHELPTIQLTLTNATGSLISIENRPQNAAVVYCIYSGPSQ
jgi:microcystin-dependent protein